MIIIFLIHSYASEPAEEFNGYDFSRAGSEMINATYIGSVNCIECHLTKIESWNKTLHSTALVNSSVAEAAGVQLPGGLQWDDVTYVIGQKWKVLYVNDAGKLLTYNASGPGGNQWDVRDQEWTDFHAGADLDFNCGSCHTTGYNSEGSQDGLSGIVGTWIEDGIGCEACHGPGSEHVKSMSNKGATIIRDPTSESCGKCHQRIINGKTNQIDPERAHRGQYNDWYISEHNENEVDCVFCHDPHDTSHDMYSSYGNHQEVEPAKVKFFKNGLYMDVSSSTELCGKCHPDKEKNLEHGALGVNAVCVDCHMAYSRISMNKWDIRSHTFKVDDNIMYDPDVDPNTANYPFFTCEGSECHGKGVSNFEDWERSAHADSNHGDNTNTYCSHCMAPFSSDPDATHTDNDPVSGTDWTGINCAVCHDIHNSPSSISLFNGSSGERDSPVSDPSKLCGACHNSDHHPEYKDWSGSAHAKANHGRNANTYCAHCMSPLEAEAGATYENNDVIEDRDWNGIGCIVCHDEHSLELSLYTPFGRKPSVTDPAELCGECHNSEKHPQYDLWNGSAHANPLSSSNNNGNTFCARCHSPFQADPYAELSTGKPIDKNDWNGITCTVCHNYHSLELSFWNGSGYEEIDGDNSVLCIKCHSGTDGMDSTPVVKNITGQWESSAHYDTYKSFNGNTYCSHCMAPYQSDPLATSDKNEPVKEEDWNAIGCTVCHEPHSSGLSIYNGSVHNEVSNTNELCGSCHTMGNVEAGEEVHHPQLEMRTAKKIGGVKSVQIMETVYCSDCHAYGGNHTFEMNVEACIECHPSYDKGSAASQIQLWQEEISALMNVVYHNMTLAKKAKDRAEPNGTWNDDLDNSLKTALFNYEFVAADGSFGAHNPDYAKVVILEANKNAVYILNSLKDLPSIKISPVADARNVSVDTLITVQFEEEVRFNEIKENLMLKLIDGTIGALAYDWHTYTIIFTPGSNLSYETVYTVNLSSDIRYADYTSVLREDFIWSFTTANAPPEELSIEIGPIYDKSNHPIEGAKISVIINGSQYSGLTNINGKAKINILREDLIHGNYSLTVTKTGYENKMFEGNIDPNGTFLPASYGPIALDRKSDIEETDYMQITAVIIIIVLILLFISIRKRRMAVIKDAAVPDETEKETAISDKFTCPKCGRIIVETEQSCKGCGIEFNVDD